MARSLFGLIIGLIFVVCLSGASYQAIVAYTDARRYPEPGRLIDIGGFHLKLNCTGSGSPTVVLEAGLGDLLEEWRKVQPEIASSPACVPMTVPAMEAVTLDPRHARACRSQRSCKRF